MTVSNGFNIECAILPRGLLGLGLGQYFGERGLWVLGSWLPVFLNVLCGWDMLPEILTGNYCISLDSGPVSVHRGMGSHIFLTWPSESFGSIGSHPPPRK